MSETALMREILCSVSALKGALFWRVNVGVSKSVDGRTIRYGLPGQADIAGCYRGRHVEIEVKTPKGRLSIHQERWKDAIQRAGGLFIVARTPNDALEALSALEDEVVEPSSRAEPLCSLEGHTGDVP